MILALYMHYSYSLFLGLYTFGFILKCIKKDQLDI